MLCYVYINVTVTVYLYIYVTCFMWLGCNLSRILKPRASKFALPQTRCRVYIIMVQDNLMSPAQLSALCHIISNGFPEMLEPSLKPCFSVEEIRTYTEMVLLALDKTPTKCINSKDPVERSWQGVWWIGIGKTG